MSQLSLILVLLIITFTGGCHLSPSSEKQSVIDKEDTSSIVICELRHRLKQTSVLLSHARFINHDAVLCSEQDFNAGCCFAPACAPCRLEALDEQDLCMNPGPLGTGNLCRVSPKGALLDIPCCTQGDNSCQLGSLAPGFHNVLSGVNGDVHIINKVPSNYDLFLPLENRYFDIDQKRCVAK